MFDSITWGEAVRYVQTVGQLSALLVLAIPIAALIALHRGRRHRPGEQLLFPRVVLWVWGLLLLGGIAYFLTGAWYGESGPPPQQVAVQATISLAVIALTTVAIAIGLYRSTQPRRDTSPTDGA